MQEGRMLIGAVTLLVLIAGTAEEPPPPPPKGGDKPPEAAFVTNNPFDSRHVEVTASVDAKTATILGIAVWPGEAHAQLADSSRLRIRLLNAAGDVVQESGFPNPLSERVYVQSAPSGDGAHALMSDLLETPPPGVPPHVVVVKDEATVTIVLPLRADLVTLSLGWKDGPVHELDVRTAIRDACAKDAHPVCQAWMKVSGP
jgi:hypothetical protein